MRSACAVTCARKRQRRIGVKSPSPMEHTLFTPPVPSVRSSSAVNRDTSDWSSRGLWIKHTCLLPDNPPSLLTYNKYSDEHSALICLFQFCSCCFVFLFIKPTFSRSQTVFLLPRVCKWPLYSFFEYREKQRDIYFQIKWKSKQKNEWTYCKQQSICTHPCYGVFRLAGSSFHLKWWAWPS